MPTVRIFNYDSQTARPPSAAKTTSLNPISTETVEKNMTCWSGCCTHYARAGFCLCLVILAFLLDVIGFATPYWYKMSTPIGMTFAGLWKECVNNAGVVTCTNLPTGSSETWFKANQGLQSIGMILLLAGVVLTLTMIVCCKGYTKIRIAAIVLLLSAATFILIGVIIYGAESVDMITSNLHFSFAFVVSAAGLAIVGAICLCMGIHDSWETDEIE